MNEPWGILWDRAMLAIDSDNLRPVTFTWSFGGGTAMRLFYEHRYSKDIDIFVNTFDALGALSPRLNSTVERLTADSSGGQTWLKLRFEEGEVDFIASGPVLPEVPFVRREIRGRMVDVETPLEIVAKKCVYRAIDFRPRDVYDLAVLLDKEPDAVRRHAAALLQNADVLRARLGAIENGPRAENFFDAIFRLDVPRTFEPLRSSAFERVAQFIGLRA